MRDINGSKPTSFPLDEEKLSFKIPCPDRPPREKILKLGSMITNRIGLKATVDSSVFLGLNTHYFAHTDDGDKIEIIQESQIDSIIPDGTVVRLGVKTEKINVFDAEGKQNLLEGVRNDNAV